jgi:hypothetical protein
MCNCTNTSPCGLYCICCGRRLPVSVRVPWFVPPQPVRFLPVIPDFPQPIQTILPWLGRLVLTQ